MPCGEFECNNTASEEDCVVCDCVSLFVAGGWMITGQKGELLSEMMLK